MKKPASFSFTRVINNAAYYNNIHNILFKIRGERKETIYNNGLESLFPIQRQDAAGYSPLFHFTNRLFGTNKLRISTRDG